MKILYFKIFNFMSEPSHVCIKYINDLVFFISLIFIDFWNWESAMNPSLIFRMSMSLVIFSLDKEMWLSSDYLWRRCNKGTYKRYIFNIIMSHATILTLFWHNLCYQRILYSHHPVAKWGKYSFEAKCLNSRR